MSSDEYHVYLRGPDRKRVLLMDDYTSLTLVPNFNDSSKWILELPGNSAALDLVDAGYGIIVEHEAETDPVLSGNVRTLLQKSDDAGTLTMTLSGLDDTAILADRQALPCAPSGSSGLVYAASGYDNESGLGETVMRAFVTNSAINVNPITGLAQDTNTSLGSTVSEQARFGTLMELLQSVAIHAGGLGFRVVQDPTSTALLFKVYKPTDRSSTIVFSRFFGNLQSYSYQTQAPTCNHVIVAGGGDLAARTFYELTDDASIARWGRVTAFVDQRQTTDTTKLIQAAHEAITNGAEKNSLSIVPIDSSSMRYGHDYRVGDIARVDITADDSITDVIRQATLTIKAGEGLVVKPVVGNSQATDPTVPDFFKKNKDLATRLTSLEAS